ncbi:MAG: FliM/FliN family flagellar motor switch protein [Sphingomonas sp.]|uniref:FliM/FliN family flagellar motor switch protein n=1 Tax=Sphingomonas sp. TaxID=28214 RepID=UPI002272EBF8|nr:FliM/FliN family flagellar motor switch protein [Sphingomonas sp.]MCX8475468.1 FliM/FliN family flagellar motor switch protein [Sphingomonas sp.]
MNDPVTDQSKSKGTVTEPAEGGPRVSTRLIKNVPVQLEAFVGNVRMTVAELTALGADSVVTLDTPLNQSVELRLNQLPVARGELVAVGDKFGVRISEIVQWPE